MARADETFIVFNFDQLWERYSDDTDGILCISGRDRAMLLSLLSFSSWPSRWIGNVAGNPNAGYDSSLLRNNDRFEDLETALSFVESLERKIIMAGCFEELSAAIVAQGEAIKAGLLSLANKTGNCCGAGQGGSGGAGTGPGPSLSEEDTGTPGGHTGDPPEGFSSWEEYDAYKCAVITWILDTMIEDLQRTATVQFGTAFTVETAAALIAAGLISPIPGDEILIIAGLTVTASVMGILSGLYSNIGEAVNDARNDITCALFNGATAGGSQSEAQAAIDAALDASMDAVTASIAKRIAAAYLTGANLNRLYVKDESRTYEAADCSECLPEEFKFFGTPEVVGGTVEKVGANTWTFDTGPDANFEGHFYCNLGLFDSAENGVPFYISDVSFSSFEQGNWYEANMIDALGNQRGAFDANTTADLVGYLESGDDPDGYVSFWLQSAVRITGTITLALL